MAEKHTNPIGSKTMKSASDKEITSALIRKNTPMPLASVADMQAVGTAIAQSGMFGINNAGAGLVVALTCHSQGISLMEFARTYHVIDNKPSMRADAMLAEFRKRGGKYVIVENSVTRAAADFEFEGNKLSGAFTMDDAARTGDCFKADGKTLKHNWQHRAENMLWARMVSRTVRLLCPEIVAGLYTPEEVEDFRGPDNARAVTTISGAEASARASKIVDVLPAPPPQLDFSVDPKTGIRFEDLNNEGLAEAWDDPMLLEGHREVLKRIADERRKEGKA